MQKGLQTTTIVKKRESQGKLVRKWSKEKKKTKKKGERQPMTFRLESRQRGLVKRLSMSAEKKG